MESKIKFHFSFGAVSGDILNFPFKLVIIVSAHIFVKMSFPVSEDMIIMGGYDT